MEMEDAMVFWESHFTRLLSHDNFQKQYAYSFRHMYGKEGARKNYTPYSCMKIIMGAPPEAGGEYLWLLQAEACVLDPCDPLICATICITFRPSRIV